MMDLAREEAALLLTSLLARLEADAAADRPQFRGVVSDAEREALRMLLGAVGVSPLSDRLPTGPEAEPPRPVQPPESMESPASVELPR